MRWKWWLIVVVLVGAFFVWLWPRRAHDPTAARKENAGRALEHAVRAGAPVDWLGQPGVAGRRIAGRVTHAGAPVANAQVRLTTEELRIGQWALATVASDDRGHFDFGERPATRFRVVASVDGLAPAAVEVDLRMAEPSDALEIELGDCSLVIAGTVRDAAGGVVAEARVRAGTAAGVLAPSVADGEGRYRVCSSAGNIHVEASADGYGTAVEHRSNAHGEVRVDFALSPEVVIAGQVLGDAGGPIEGATVLAATNGHDPGAFAETGSDGRFRLDGLAVGSYRVIARDGDRVAQKFIDARPAGRTFELALTLAERAPIKGRVVAAGAPVAGVVVTVERPNLWRRSPLAYGSAVTRSDGSFALAGLPAKEKVVFRVEGHKVTKPAGAVEIEGVETVELECERLAKVSGRVVRRGVPVADANVDLQLGNDRLRESTKADGTFRFAGVRAGRWKLGADSVGAGAMAATRGLEVGKSDIENLVIDLDLSASIAGMVVDETGAPVAGVRVDADGGDDGGNDVTGVDGSWKCTTLAGSRAYKMTVRRDDASFAELEAAPGTTLPTVDVPDGQTAVTGIRIAVKKGTLQISGKVVRAGQPVAGREVRAWAEHGGGMANTLADGTFVLSNLTAGTYQVSVSAWGRRMASGKSIEVEAGAKGVVIDLPPAGTIEGELHGFSSDATVVALRGGEGGAMSREDRVMARDLGEAFTLDDLAAGEWVVTATVDGGGRATAKVTVVENQTAHVVLEAGPTAHLDGTVTDWRTGAPIESGACSWSSADGGHGFMSQLSPGGIFSSDIPAGPISINCFGVGDRVSVVTKPVEIDLPPGGSTHRDIQIVTLKNALSREWVPFSVAGDPPVVARAEAGIGPLDGDRVLSVNGDAIAGLSAQAVDLLLFDHAPGEPVRIVVERDGKEQSFDVSPRAR